MRSDTERLIVQTMQVFKPAATLRDFSSGCRRLILGDDFMPFTRDFSKNEIFRLADGIFQYITGASEDVDPYITLEKYRPLIESGLRASKLASGFSWDIVLGQLGYLVGRLGTRENRPSDLISAFAAICFRYVFCFRDGDAFPFRASFLADLGAAARELTAEEDADLRMHETVFWALMTLRSCEVPPAHLLPTDDHSGG